MSIEKENYQIVKSQEELLRFIHFDNYDAWNLGKQIVQYAFVHGRPHFGCHNYDRLGFSDL